MGTAIGMVKINLKQSGTAYGISAVVLTLAIASYITSIFVPGSQDNTTVAIGNFFYLLPLLMPIFIPAKNFNKLMNLGGKRRDFFTSCILVYLLVAAVVTLVSIVLHFTIDRYMVTQIAGVLDLLAVFGFMARGPVVAFLQMWAFLTMFSCVVHTLTLIQGRWYGFVVDVLIIAIISTFTPIAALRPALIWFFNLIIFHDIAIVQIASCLALGAAVYCASLIPIRNKRI